MADGKRRAPKRQEGDPKQGGAAERELEKGLEPGVTDMETALEESPQPLFESSESFETDAELPEAELFADAQAAVDADIAAANSDIEAAAEDMGAQQSLEPAQPGQAGIEQPEVVFQPQFQAWPSVQPTFRRSKAEEANAFFAFTERLRQEFNPNAPDRSAPVPVDPPDPADRALFGAANPVSPPEDEEDSEHYAEEYGDPDYDTDDFYIGDDGYGSDGEDGHDVEVDIETEADEDNDPDGDESDY